MERPSCLDHRDPKTANDIVSATAAAILPAFVEEGILLTSELGYGYEDIPLTSELAMHLVETVILQHPPAPAPLDVAVLRKAFMVAFALGLDLASQMHDDDEGLRLDLEAVRLIDPDAPFLVESPLADQFASWQMQVGNVFARLKDRSLAPAESTGDRSMALDHLAAGCMWSCLAGIEAGLCHLEGTPLR
ncbi:MAG TPA: hypothetical protein PKO15_14335 [Fibrobacteria bacterium]|nr:hypothetical protein [Fibrobacteria bacterium]HOX51442.1 hypothetical protein [Fibrobacteria bacterium]